MSDVLHGLKAELRNRYADALCVTIDVDLVTTMDADTKEAVNAIQGIYYKIHERIHGNEILPAHKGEDLRLRY